MKKLTPLFFTFAVLLTACSGESGPAIPDTLPDITGNVTQLNRTSDENQKAVATILVEAVGGVDSIQTKASIKIDGNTLIEDQDGAKLKLEQLREGNQVDAWFDGPVLESFPVQAHASAIRVIAR